MMFWKTIWALAVIAVIIAHEYGHFLVAHLHGLEPYHPFFIPLGFAVIGATSINVRQSSNEVKAQVALAGPIFGTITAWAIAIGSLIHGFMIALFLLAIFETRSIFFGADAKRYNECF